MVDESRPTGGTGAIIALILGAVGVAFAPIFARLAVDHDGRGTADMLSPTAVAFWRMALAAPFFLWPWWRAYRAGRPGTDLSWTLMLPGLFFALDLGIWHWAFEFTSVANATLEANLAVVVVALVSWLWFKDPLKPLFVVGTALALAGMARLVGASFGIEGDAWKGDLMGIWAGVAYGAYQIATKVELGKRNVVTVMAWACVSCSVCLALGSLVAPGHFVPRNWTSWTHVLLLTLSSQIVGQGLIVYGLSRTSAGLAAVLLLLQPVVAAFLSWIILGQNLSPVQMLSGLVVLVGIYLAKRGSMSSR